jgi:hypothetical protein
VARIAEDQLVVPAATVAELEELKDELGKSSDPLKLGRLASETKTLIDNANAKDRIPDDQVKAINENLKTISEGRSMKFRFDGPAPAYDKIDPEKLINVKKTTKTVSKRFMRAERQTGTEPSRLTAEQRDIVKTQLTPRAMFSHGCTGNGIFEASDKTEVDYLALKKMLLKIVDDQNQAMTYGGNPELSLDSVVLTSAFQIVLDTSAATKHIFRIFPLVAPPQMGVKPDHTHTLKVTFQGAKKKSSPNSGRDLEVSCLERLQPGLAKGDTDPGDIQKFCSSAPGRLLEQIAASLESGSRSSSGGAAGGGGGE